MRAIKFRGKNNLTGEWVYGSGIYNVLGHSYITKESPFGYEVFPETVGQFTGLTDKHGTDIYEGDIIRSSRNGFGGVVMWHKDGYFYICDDMERKDLNDYNKLGVMLKKHPHFVVEGNVVDNPLHNPKLN